MIGVVSGVGHFARVFRRGTPGDAGPDIDWLSGAAMAFRREVWTDAGPLNERFRFYCQDIEFCARARDAGWRVHIVPEARVIRMADIFMFLAVIELRPQSSITQELFQDSI